jgi:D-alanyl-D-alanine carboxypeptidase/D-alanyl-D-alanine-endopeptidase (penicillin-binding protein 4)
MQIRFGWLVVVLAVVAGGCRSRSAELAERILPVLHRLDSTGAIVSARVIELKTGNVLLEDNPDSPFIPASNQKLLVTAAALDLFDPEQEFETVLAFDGTNLILVGSGDPGIGDARIAAHHDAGTMTVLERFADALKARGIQSIPGKLLWDDRSFEDRILHPTWEKDDLPYWYAAPVAGLNFNTNCIDFTVFPRADGEPVGYTMVPPVRNITVVNNGVSGSDAEPKLERDVDKPVYTISGGAKERFTHKGRPVIDPGAFFADALATHLAGAGIEIAGGQERAPSRMGRLPEEWIVARHVTQLGEILPRINKNSQNMMAEALCKIIGREHASRSGREEPGSWDNGAQAIEAFFDRHGIDRSGVRVADGSGLSRENRVTTRAISELLRVMHDHRHGEVFRESLGVGGRDGTIENRLKEIEGRVYAKTGYIGGVRSLSGYIHTRRGEWLVFSILYNKIPGTVKPYEALQDETLRYLYEWPTVPSTLPSRGGKRS